MHLYIVHGAYFFFFASGPNGFGKGVFWISINKYTRRDTLREAQTHIDSDVLHSIWYLATSSSQSLYVCGLNLTQTSNRETCNYHALEKGCNATHRKQRLADRCARHCAAHVFFIWLFVELQFSVSYVLRRMAFAVVATHGTWMYMYVVT